MLWHVNVKCQLSNVKWQLVYNYKNESNLRSSCSMLAIQRWMSYDKCQMSNGKCQMTNVKCQMANVKCQMSNVKCQMSNGKCQLSNVKWQLVYNYKNESNLRSCSMSDVCNICQVECTGQTGQSEEGGEKKKIAETRHASVASGCLNVLLTGQLRMKILLARVAT